MYEMPEKKSTKIGTIGIDTSFLIDFFQGESEAVEFMKNNLFTLRINELIVYEFLCGNLSSNDENLFLKAIQSIPSLEFKRESSLFSSKFFRDGRKSGKTLGHQDCMIAGCYFSHGVSKIVTRNVKHFSNIKEIEVIEY